MALATKYRGQYIKSGNTYKIDVELEGYGGGVTTISKLMPNPIQIKRRGSRDNKNGIVLGSELQFNFYSTSTDAGQFNEIFTGAYKDWRISYYRGSTLIWRGWLKSENQVREFINDQYEINLSASDGLADLKEVQYVDFTTGSRFDDRVTILQTLKRVFEHIEIPFDFEIFLNTQETALMTTSECPLNVATIDSRRFNKVVDGRTISDDCYSVLENILRIFNSTIQQAEGAWWIISKYETSSSKFNYDFSTLTETRTASLSLVEDLTGFDYKRRGTLERLPVIIKNEVTFKNKNLGDNLIVNGDFASGTANWTNNGFDTFSVSSGEATLITTTPTDYLQSDNFTISPTGKDSIQITYSIKLDALSPAEQIYAPFYEMRLFNGTSEISAEDFGSNFLTYEGDWATYTTTFPVTSVGSTYNIRLYISEGALPLTSATVLFREVSSKTIFASGSESTFDSLIIAENTTTTGQQIDESVILFGDSLQTTDIGALKIGGTLTTVWTRVSKGDTNKPLHRINALIHIVDNSAYKNYLKITIYDISDVIKLYKYLLIDSITYRIINYSKDHFERTLDVELEEVIQTDPSVTYTLQPLNSVDGQSTTNISTPTESSSDIIDDSTTSTTKTWSSSNIDTVKEDAIGAKGTAFNKNFGTSSGTVSQGNHNHSGTYEPTFSILSVSKGGTGTGNLGSNTILLGNGVNTPTQVAPNTAFNKAFGSSAGQVSEGDHNHSGVYEPVITALPVSKGGTGRSVLTSGDILVGNGTGLVTMTDHLIVAQGGTGVTTHTSGGFLRGAGSGDITSTAIFGTGAGNVSEGNHSHSTLAPLSPSFLTKTASYTLASGDNGKVILFNTGSSVNLTMAVSLGTGFNVQVINIHPTGVVTLVAGSATLNSKEVKLSSQWGGCTIIYSGTSTAIAMGDLTST